eukprot:782543-Amorphochlora_amoeboformis.AAC.1
MLQARGFPSKCSRAKTWHDYKHQQPKTNPIVISSGDGPLHIATEMEDLATVKYLVENAKANIKAVNKY